MRQIILIAIIVVTLLAWVRGQTPTYVPLPTGMRIVVGSTGALLRAVPLTYTCDEPPVECSNADVIAPNVYGVVQSDAPILDPAGWYWARVVFEASTQNGQNTGWVSGLSPYVNILAPPQMVAGANFAIGASYGPGPILTQAVCILDGASSPATMQLQNVTCCSDNGPGHAGTLVCPWPNAGTGNHIAVIKAVNSKGTADSEEFQFAVTAAPVSQPPTQPGNMRITVP